MNEELSKKLLDDFPLLFRNRHETSMQRGFECGDGWFELIYKLSQDIEAVARQNGLNPDSPKWPLCRQVKEKLGSLRFVVFAVDGLTEVNERISELRVAALDQSLQICEKCGKPGKFFQDSMATLCPEHASRITKMTTAYLTHPACLLHEMGVDHPERPDRLRVIEEKLIASGLMDKLIQVAPPSASIEELARVHTYDYIESVFEQSPESGLAYLDMDTSMNPYTLDAALFAAGAVVLGVDLVLDGKVKNAFCNIRPPGHHATGWRASGFCIFNNVAIGALHALEHHGLKRVAIADFDVHHGDGTDDIFHDDPRVMLLSTFQYPFYPFRGAKSGNDHIINVPLPEGTGSQGFRFVVTRHWLPALERFQPELILISAGFDAHENDKLAGLNLTTDDYAWVTRELMQFAGGHIVSVLEGGYELDALGQSAVAHVRQLMNCSS